ncbi:MAG: hypothetical protein HYZ16_02095 [Bacteroidetes bacterium]|nr:hypothetical protein [Bacteroidota bacterium]
MNYKKPHAICAAASVGGPYHLRVMVPLQTTYGTILLSETDCDIDGFDVRQFTLDLQSPGASEVHVHMQEIECTPSPNIVGFEVRVMENGIVQGIWRVAVQDVQVKTMTNEDVCFHAEDLGGNNYQVSGIQNISTGYVEHPPVVDINDPFVELTFEYEQVSNSRTNPLYHSHMVNIPDTKILKGKKKKKNQGSDDGLIWIFKIPYFP